MIYKAPQSQKESGKGKGKWKWKKKVILYSVQCYCIALDRQLLKSTNPSFSHNR